MTNLGPLLADGADGVDADPARAVVLFSLAIDERGNTSAMYNLANLLDEGADDVDADPARAVELYCRSIDEGRHIGAMYTLACLLEDGADGVEADPARVVDLYSRAIDEEVARTQRRILQICLPKVPLGWMLTPPERWSCTVEQLKKKRT